MNRQVEKNRHPVLVKRPKNAFKTIIRLGK